MEHISENISEDVIHIAALEMIFLIAALSAGTVSPPESAGTRASESRAGIAVSCAGSGGLVKGRIAELVVQLSLLRKIQQYRPVIVVDSTLPGLTSIELDRYRKGRVLGEALLAEGRKRVLFIQSQRYHDTTFRGCRDLFAEAGIDLPEQNFFLNGEGLEELLKSGFRPQAVAPCLERFNYIVDLLRKYRIDLYEECRMATFMFKPMDMPEPIMLFTFPFEEFGKETVKQVKKRLADPSLPPEHIVFDFQYKMNIL